jgi:hypothetical protein
MVARTKPARMKSRGRRVQSEMHFAALRVWVETPKPPFVELYFRVTMIWKGEKLSARSVSLFLPNSNHGIGRFLF